MHLHRDCRGDGPSVVLSHGLGDDHTTWSALVPLLAAGCATTAWDLRGHGRSDAPTSPDAYGPEHAVADLLAVITAGDAPVHLVGHSLGGFISLTVALQRPELVRSLTMIGSGPGYRDATARDKWNRYVDQSASTLGLPLATAALAHQRDSWVIDHVGELVPPLMVIVGEHDVRFHPGAAYLGRRVPRSAVHQIAGARHHVQRSHPDEVARLVVDHVDAATTANGDGR